MRLWCPISLTYCWILTCCWSTQNMSFTFHRHYLIFFLFFLHKHNIFLAPKKIHTCTIFSSHNHTVEKNWNNFLGLVKKKKFHFTWNNYFLLRNFTCNCDNADNGHDIPYRRSNNDNVQNSKSFRKNCRKKFFFSFFSSWNNFFYIWIFFSKFFI